MAVWEQMKIVLVLLLCRATIVHTRDYDAEAVVPALLPLCSRPVRNPALKSFVPPPSGGVFSKVAREAGAHILMFLLF